TRDLWAGRGGPGADGGGGGPRSRHAGGHVGGHRDRPGAKRALRGGGLRRRQCAPDAVRGILDGHIVMERVIAERGRYPAINVLKSISRTMPKACDAQYLVAVTRAKRLLSIYGDTEELIRLGAYRQGSNAETDEAIGLFP